MDARGLHLLEKKNQQGFTIVELLIVILIIGILVTLVIVTYNGIMGRAENTKTIDAVKAWSGILRNYAVDNGAYPTNNYPCLGSYPTYSNHCADTTGGAIACLGNGQASVDAVFDNLFTQYNNGNKPQPSLQTINCAGRNFVGAGYSGSPTPRIFYYLKGNINPCPSISGDTVIPPNRLDDLTICGAYLPAI